MADPRTSQVSAAVDAHHHLWDLETNEKMDKDRFRRDMGNVTEAYAEVARRLGIMKESGQGAAGGDVGKSDATK